MDATQFCYWLQGFTEISQTVPTPAQWQIIQDHLEKFFKKEEEVLIKKVPIRLYLTELSQRQVIPHCHSQDT